MLWGLAREPDCPHHVPTPRRHASRSVSPLKQSASTIDPDYVPISLVCKMKSLSPTSFPEEGCLVAGHFRPSPDSTTLARRVTGLMRSSLLVIATLVTFIAVTPAQAARIPFRNCLDESYRLNDPPPLQWVPIYADAVFDLENDSHNLRVTVWGNVSGSQNRATLPPADDPYWQNDNDTNGKIIRLPPEGEGRLLTTLFRRVHVLTYQPWKESVSFCDDGLVNGTCPLSPSFRTGNDSDLSTPPYDLPSMYMSHDFFSSYAFTSFTPTFVITNGDNAATDIGCVSATVTPDLGSLAWVLKFLPLLVLLLSGLAVVMAGIFSPWGTTNIFHWTSNYGRDADLLRLVTPGFGDCLQYIQFVALTGGLSLNYPGFYQPIVSQVGWSALMFNRSFVANAESWQSVVDGIYVTDGSYGLQVLGQLIGMARSEDIWAGMMVWLCVIIGSVFLLTQLGFLLQWLHRRVRNTPEEDLRSKNIPFSVGNVVRIVLNYFLLPIIALSCFQLVVADQSPSFTVALAVITLVLLLGFAGWLLYFIISTRPKAFLFDDLTTVLRYGPLYNTYSDEAAAFALIPVLLSIIRGIGIGAVQLSGIAQVVLLAICEVIQILTVHAFRPFHSPTSMNAYHTIFSALRLVTIMLMVAFSPTLGVDDGTKGWIGYVILLIHGIVLVLGYFLNALQTLVEVIARMLGAGGDDIRGQTRGGLSKIFGARQLSRRVNHRPGPSRASQLSTAAMLDAEDGTRSGYAMPSGRIRSDSAASLSQMGGHHRHRSSTALDSIDMYSNAPRHMDNASSYAPGTPGEASTFSFLPSPSAARYAHPALPSEAADPYYRPPRRRRGTLNESVSPDKQQRLSLAGDPIRLSQIGGPPPEPLDAEVEIPRGSTPAPPGASNTVVGVPANRPDYSTREVDFYYGVRGPALNSDGPGRKLGTGPADPTGPVATATGWFRNMFGGKIKEKGKGFEVVRSARMPPAMMARNGAFGDETPPEGIPVAMGVLRNGPIESDDEDEPQAKRANKPRVGKLLTDEGEPQESESGEPESPVAERLPGTLGGSTTKIGAASQHQEADRNNSLLDDELELPEIPRKSSKRHSASVDGGPSPSLRPIDGDSQDDTADQSQRTLSIGRLPFERSASQKRLSSNSSLDFPEEFTHVNMPGARAERPLSFGTVPHHGISRVDPTYQEVDLLGSAAELVEGSTGTRPSPQPSTSSRR
ncbi:membrane protein [Paramyrothecium foliicola]|nr:membrane protein [Paramyrothecium foliicola]